jgi:hypothetical protein
MFDDVKPVQGWMNMACHVYNLVYHKKYDHCYLWYAIKGQQNPMYIVEAIEHSCFIERSTNPNFKGFMANNAEEN